METKRVDRNDLVYALLYMSSQDYSPFFLIPMTRTSSKGKRVVKLTGWAVIRRSDGNFGFASAYSDKNLVKARQKADRIIKEAFPENNTRREVRFVPCTITYQFKAAQSPSL